MFKLINKLVMVKPSSQRIHINMMNRRLAIVSFTIRKRRFKFSGLTVLQGSGNFSMSYARRPNSATSNTHPIRSFIAFPHFFLCNVDRVKVTYRKSEKMLLFKKYKSCYTMKT